MIEASTVKQILIVRVSESSDHGVSYTLVDPVMEEFYGNGDEWTVLGEIDVPRVDCTLEMGVAKIDNEIASLQAEIDSRKEKKKQIIGGVA